MAIKGQVGLWNEHSIAGWIIAPEFGQPVEFEVVLDGKVIATLVADLDRPDVAQATGTDGQCGLNFNFPPNLDRPARARARLRFAGSNLYLEPTVRPAAPPPPAAKPDQPPAPPESPPA